MGFFFEPSSRIVDGKLEFDRQGTSSSGSFVGRYGQVPISGPDAIEALQSRGVFWLEPDGREVRLDVQTTGSCAEPNKLLHATAHGAAREQ